MEGCSNYDFYGICNVSCTFKPCEDGDVELEYCPNCEDGYYTDIANDGKCKAFPNEDNSKRNEVKDISEIEFYDPRVAQESAERDFDIIFNVQQSNYDTKFISNLLTMKQIKTNNDTVQRKDKRYKNSELL